MSVSEHTRRSLGMTVAIWYPPTTGPHLALAMLRRTLDDVELFVSPSRLCLVVDGCPHAESTVRQAAAEVADRSDEEPMVDIKPTNEGQGGAVARGVELLLGNPDVEYICTRDMDGDHDIYDAPQLFRSLTELQAHLATDRVYMVGGRGDLHRPMGYARGALEQVLNEVTVQTLLAMHAPLHLAHSRIAGRDPDLQSGYKIYTRWAAELAARSLRDAARREPEILPLRWGVQFISTVELLLAGATPACQYRLTYDQQPQSTFEGLDNLPRAYGCQLAWLFRRLQVPPETAWPILDTSLAGTLLGTAPGGAEAITGLREYVSERAFAGSPPAFLAPGRMF